jgi:hypothetical protein
MGGKADHGEEERVYDMIEKGLGSYCVEGR